MAVNKKYKKTYKKNINIKENKVIEQSITLNNDIKQNKKISKGPIVLLLIILFLSLLIPYFPRIVLYGEEHLVINYNESYTEPGYNGYILTKDITKDITVSNNIDNGVIGNYEVNYYINLPGARVKKTRYIDIIDNISPIINVEKENLQLCPNEEIKEIKFQAIDGYDGDITSNVKETITDNEIFLTVKDSSSNEASLTIKIDRLDKESPVIELKGNSNIYLSYGNTYTEPGYTATDNCSKDLTNKVSVSGTVGRNIGTYTLTYSVSDESGNSTSIKRKVIIKPNFVDTGAIHNGSIYLTFDDGPSQGTTNKILDILQEEGVKATFFVTSKGPDSLIKRMHNEGHTIALHTANHNYGYIYSSVENYFNDLKQVSNRVKNITGIDSKIIRFPGGSSNTVSRNYRQGIMTELSNILLNDGYRYFDWNVDGKDASSARNSQDVYYNVTSNLSPYRANVVLLHDTKNITASTLKDIIKFGKEYGYSFNKIDMNTYMVRHKINN